MKKYLSLLLVAAFLLAFAGCAAPAAEVAPAAEAPAAEEPAAAAPAAEEPAAAPAVEEAKIAEVISSTGNIDDRSFCEGAWNGIKKYADENSLKYAYYQATGESTDDIVNAIGVAVAGGAEIVICPGFALGAAVFKAQDKYPDTNIVLLDGEPHSEDWSEFRQEANVYSIYYAEEESGFLAGYGAVKDGFTKLGFLGGMAVPAVVRFGYGFVAGAEQAAKEMGLAEGSLTMYYHYLGNFDVSPENQTYAASWYSNGIEVIFAAAGDVTSVVSSAAAQIGADKWVVGVDVNQGWDAKNVLTSATKNLANSTYDALDLHFKGQFPGGKVANLAAAQDGINLPTDTETWRFKKFTVAEYETVLNQLKTDEGGLASGIPVDTDYETADKIPTKYVVVTVF